jgi:ribosome maturation factor RimP
MDLEGWVRPVVEAAGLDLVDLGFQRGNGVHLLRVTVHRRGGVDLDAIADVSGRPLRRPQDFSRSVGEKVKVKMSRPIDGVRSIRGTIVEAGEDAVRIATDEGERKVSYGDIASARTVFEWESKGVKR